MTFRKNGLLFAEHMVLCGLSAAVCIALWPIDQIGASPYLSLLFIACMLLTPLIHSEFITINEDGIFCHRKGKQIWNYKWSEIGKLKKSSRFRMPSVEIVIDGHMNEAVPYDFSEHYFQLSRKAHKAIVRYYQPENDTHF